MWCHHCESDVAAEVEAGERRARCANCGTQIAARGTPANAARTREALKLLDRWSRPHLLDPFQTTPGERDEPADDFVAATSPISPEDDTMADDYRIDETDEDSTQSDPAAEDGTETESGQPPLEHLPLQPPVVGLDSVPSRVPAESQPRVVRATPELSTNSSAHGDVREAVTPDSGADWVATAGQLLAYAGVAVLTVGTTLALWGHFGNHPDHVPTGWLVAAAGQMLLFLGIVTLVSSGVEDNARALQSRFDRVVRRLERVEDELARGREGRNAPRMPSSHEERRAA